jgi:YggT family protein
MTFFSDLLVSIADLIGWITGPYILLIIIYAVISWVPTDPTHPIVKILRILVEPSLKPIRNIIPPDKTGGIDLSPIFAVLVIKFLAVLLTKWLYSMATTI